LKWFEIPRCVTLPGHILFVLLFLFAGIESPSRAAVALPPKPEGYFNDYAKVVSPAVANRLNETLAGFERSSSSQILVAIFPRLPANAALEDFTFRTAQSWRVGQKTNNSGAVLFVFVGDHKLRIEVGYGLEGALPDALARRIIDDEITPRFRKNDYDGGLTAGVNAIMQAVRGEYKGIGRTVQERRRSSRHFNPGLIILFLFLFFVIASFRRRRGTLYHRGGRTY